MISAIAQDMFDQQAARYDAWYDTLAGSAAFAEEIDALRPLAGGLPRSWLEVGVGTGRPASALPKGSGGFQAIRVRSALFWPPGLEPMVQKRARDSWR